MKFFYIFLSILSINFCKSNFNYQIPIDSNSEKIKITQMKTNTKNQIFLIEDFNYWKTNSLFLITQKNTYFFTSGWTNKSAQQILWKAKTQTLLPFKALILISPSLDFSGGIFEFIEEEIPIYIQKEGHNHLIQNWESWNKQMKKKFLSWKENLEIPPFSGIIENQFTIEDNIFIFYPGKILEQGNLVLYFSEEEILYAGNLLFDPEEIQLSIENYDINKWENFLKELDKFKIKTIISGKGTAIHSKSLINKLLKFIKKINN